MTTLLGFAALSIDLGYLYKVKCEMQVAADAAALAAAGQLATLDGDPIEAARYMAFDYAYRNKISNEGALIDPQTDVIFGQATIDPETGNYAFETGTGVIDAVRVRVRRTSDSPAGPINLFFANIFGKSEKDMWAQATAILVPRDIAIVADLSASHNDDSEFYHMNITEINMYDVWAALPGGLDESDPNYTPQKAGPTWGDYMEQAGFGTETIDSSYDPTSDSGLVYLPRYYSWNNTTIENLLAAQNYNADEIDAIMSSGYDSDSSAWKARVCVALGLAVWRSGKGPDDYGQPAKWQVEGLYPGNGNDWVGWSSELTWAESYPYSGGSWSAYCDYVKSTGTKMVRNGDSRLRYCFGVKTFVNYMLEYEPSYYDCPDLRFAPAQPMQAVKEAVDEMMNIITDLETDDQVSLESYCTVARHEVDLTQEYSAISGRLNDMQAGHYESWTNMGGGIERAIEELTSDRARQAAVKVMVLLTDGKANVNEWGQAGDYYNGPIYAKDMAQEAADLGIRIYAVSVGADSDTDTMEEIAEIGSGTHFHAEGSIEDYSAQLAAIFQTLGGKRPVMLID